MGYRAGVVGMEKRDRRFRLRPSGYRGQDGGLVALPPQSKAILVYEALFLRQKSLFCNFLRAR
jgi:hypothetical protein